MAYPRLDHLRLDFPRRGLTKSQIIQGGLSKGNSHMATERLTINLSAVKATFICV